MRPFPCHEVHRSSLGGPLKQVTEIYGLQLGIFDMGWPAAASVAYNTTVGAFIIPVCLAINIVLLLVKATNTINIDLWNYWHYAFIGAVVYFACDNIWWGFFAAIVCFVITLVMADLTTKKFQSYYKDLEGISIPQPFCQGFVPFAVGLNWCMDSKKQMLTLDGSEVGVDGLDALLEALGGPGVVGAAADASLIELEVHVPHSAVQYLAGRTVSLFEPVELVLVDEEGDLFRNLLRNGKRGFLGAVCGPGQGQALLFRTLQPVELVRVLPHSGGTVFIILQGAFRTAASGAPASKHRQ